MKKSEIAFIVSSALISLVLVAVSSGYDFRMPSLFQLIDRFMGREVYPLVAVAAFPIADEVDYRDFCIGDTDGDGIVERWVRHTDQTHSWISAYEHQGQNRYAEVFRSEQLGIYPVAAGDIDDDGKGDLFIQDGYQLTWYEAETPGGFPQILVDVFPIDTNTRGSAAIRDIDADGFKELIVACYGLNVYKCPADNVLEPVDMDTRDFVELEIMDFDNDGQLEVAATTRYDGLFIFSYAASGERTEEYTNDQGSHYNLTAGDVDNDGKPEIFVIVSSSIQVWESYAVDQYAPTTNLAFGGEDIAVADLKGDATHQLVVYGNDGNGHIFESVSDDVYAEVDQVGVGQFGEDVISYDFNGDGRSELIFDMEGYTMNAHSFLFQWDTDSTEDPWPMYRHDASRTGAGSFAGPNAQKLVWGVAFSEQLHSSPVLDKEGRVFMSTETGVKMLFKDGSPGWSAGDEYNFVGEPLTRITGGVVAVDSEGTFRAYNCLGEEDWAYPTVQTIESDLISDSQGHVYVGSEEGNFMSIGASGGMRWTIDVGSPVQCGAVLTPDELFVVFGTQDGFARSRSVVQGAFNWDVDLGNELQFGPSQDADGNTYWVTAAGRIISLNPGGSFRWEYIVNKAPAGPLVLFEQQVVFISVFDTSGTMVALNTEGTPQWVKTGIEYGGGPAVADGFGNLYFGNPENGLVACSAEGEIRWTAPFDQPVVRAAGFSNRGEVIAVDTGNVVKAFGFGLKPTPTASPPSSTGTPRPTPTARPPTSTPTPYPTYPPRTRNHNPAPNQTGVNAYTDITLEVYDPEEGVDPESIRMWIGGFAVQLELEPIYKGYRVTHNNLGIFNFDSTVEVHFTAADNCYPPHSIDPPLVYSFQIESDHYAPYVQDLSPGAGAADVDNLTPLTFEILDDGQTHVDPDSIEIEIDGIVYTPDIQEKFHIYRKGYSCTFLPEGGWPYNVPVSGVIRGRDLHIPPNVMEPVPFSFTTVNPAPRIWMGGYGNLRVTASAGGTMQFLAWVVDHGGDLEGVEVVYQGWSTGLDLHDDGMHGDGSAGDGIWGFQAQIPPGMIPDRWMLELKATDAQGKESDIWPYLTVAGDDAAMPPGWGPAGRSEGAGPSSGPSILYAGFMDTRLTATNGGTLVILAAAAPGTSGYQVQSVELFYGPIPTGVMLEDDGQHRDFAAGDGIYGYTAEIGPDMLTPGTYELNIIASDIQGQKSAPWPYFVIYPD
ncbi:VCBS repeat-containing protein [bacterium]|nr:VCBS repeat-containing protein [candidate division CSSED10-310 bacterium]